jgi:hypothetical protein
MTTRRRCDPDDSVGPHTLAGVDSDAISFDSFVVSGPILDFAIGGVSDLTNKKAGLYQIPSRRLSHGANRSRVAEFVVVWT